MRRSHISIAALALLAMPGFLSSADAQPDRDRAAQGHPAANHEPPHGGPAGGNHGNMGPAAPHGPQPKPAAEPPRPPENRGPNRPQYGHGSNGGSFNNRPGPARPGPARPAARGNGGPRHDFSNFRDFHRNFTAARRFHAPQYRRPAGWYQHRWVFGEFLPPAFWVRDYWIANYIAYALSPPPYGAVWVRVGDDALLIDQASGEVITVDYGVFY